MVAPMVADTANNKIKNTIKKPLRFFFTGQRLSNKMDVWFLMLL